MMRKIGWGVMTVLALFIALYAFAVLFVPAMRPPFLRERFLVIPVAAFLHLGGSAVALRSEEHTSAIQSLAYFVLRLLL